MPLIKSGSREAVGKNIKMEMKHGKPRKQAIAIAMSVAREHGADMPKKHSSHNSDSMPDKKQMASKMKSMHQLSDEQVTKIKKECKYC